MLVITGLGRCGTSFLAKVLIAMNYKTGKNINWHDSVDAGYELSTVHSVNHDLHQQVKQTGSIDLNKICLGDYWGKGGYGYTYREALQNFDKDKKQGPVNFVKDPRFMWHPQIIKAWWSVRKDLRFMILHRNFEDVRQSRARLPKQYDDPARGSKSVTPFKEDFADCITIMADLRIPFKIQMFPRYLIDAKPLFRDLKSLGVQVCHMEGDKMVQELKDLDKVHFGREIL
jgi:hypothetical protein